MFFGQCEPHGRRQSASLLWMLVWKRSMAWMGFVPSGSGMGMLLGSRTATPRVFCGAVRCPHGVGLFPSGRVGNVWRVVV